jgi:glutamate-1-semialdehyde 2,1-aminomutase
MPGGVSSPVRSFREVDSDPPIVRKGQGSRIFDADGKEYVDLVMSWGPLILGHAHPAVVQAVERAVRDGLTFGATCAGEVELAERVLQRFPFAQRVRFTSSGTEATMTAIRLARGVTGRSRIVKFDGCYHGHSDSLLVKAGSGLATFGIPASEGVPPEIIGLTDVLPLNDEEAMRNLFAERGDQIAAVLIEPLPANAGLLVQRRAYLRELREITTRHGALLIFDEVISGFRVAPGGVTERTGFVPDLVTLGKILGGGMPVGAIAGPEKIMERLAPQGAVYQAGTLSGNPVAMAAGVATLDELARPGVYERLEKLGADLETGIREALKKRSVAGSVARVASILWVCLQAGDAPRSRAAIADDGAKRYALVHKQLLANGVWMAPSAFEVAFLSTVHQDADIRKVVTAFDAALAALGARGAGA